MVKPETGATLTLPANALRRAAQVAAVTALRTAASELRSPTLWTTAPTSPVEVADWLDRRAELLAGTRLLDPPADALAKADAQTAATVDRDPAGSLADGGAALADVESSAATEALAASECQTHGQSVSCLPDCVDADNHVIGCPAAAQ